MNQYELEAVEPQKEDVDQPQQGNVPQAVVVSQEEAYVQVETPTQASSLPHAHIEEQSPVNPQMVVTTDAMYPSMRELRKRMTPFLLVAISSLFCLLPPIVFGGYLIVLACVGYRASSHEKPISERAIKATWTMSVVAIGLECFSAFVSFIGVIATVWTQTQPSDFWGHFGEGLGTLFFIGFLAFAIVAILVTNRVRKAAKQLMDEIEENLPYNPQVVTAV